MVRPECFKALYVTSRNVPYGPGGTWPTDNFLGGGVLAKGQTVWLKCTRDKGSAESLVPAFVEHLGPIVVDARFLVDLGQHVTSSLQECGEGAAPSTKKHAIDIVALRRNKVVDQSASIGSAW